jgi:Group II intron, maturase-specific domain
VKDPGLLTRSARMCLRRTGTGIQVRARPRRVCNGSRQGSAIFWCRAISIHGRKCGKLNRSLRGWSNYFGYGSRSKAYRSVDQYVFERVRRFLVRMHKVQGHGNRRFTFDVIHRELGVLCLQRLPRVVPSCALR